MNAIQPLDFCRVKKIHENGFGFLQSLYYEQDVFIHFSKIKDPDVKASLENVERGKVYLYFTSDEKDGKRKVRNVWLSLKNIPDKFLPDFVERIRKEFYDGKINPYELAHVINELILYKKVDAIFLEKILASPKVQRIPGLIKAFVTETNNNKAEIDDIINNIDSNNKLNKSNRNKIIALLLG